MPPSEFGSLTVVAPGIQAVVEDWPGRIGYYKYGLCISGAADHLTHRIANILVGNSPQEATIEIAGGLFECEFGADTVISICGANLGPTINDSPVPMWESIYVRRGDRLKFSYPKDYGFRAYVAIAGGIDIPLFFGSKSTCLWGKYGGYNGRALQKGDVLRIGTKTDRALVGRRARRDKIPKYERLWSVRVVPGPTASPEFVSDTGFEKLYSTTFKVDRNSDRSGYRLVMPADFFNGFWARKDGGVAGLHPSNIVDIGYPIPGGLNLTGNTLIILGPDGPCGGGYLIIGQVLYADVWKVFQAIPGRDSIRFIFADVEEAERSRREINSLLASVVE
ncbi:MAG: biotin-dependent carboxyltransferase family protein [Candidatus Caldarchaeum sp.]|nr:biotin-dependent carboxyltransferase family protein [Candidatus Caldarchaeum sp.]